mmetsp:Transcript_61384/g.70540  ORF Transcript_61384/g.70540 Transcript_61384/m.70540 type:complete len:84 (-) Transcript_61384:1024-1275(-)
MVGHDSYFKIGTIHSNIQLNDKLSEFEGANSGRLYYKLWMREREYVCARKGEIEKENRTTISTSDSKLDQVFGNILLFYVLFI